MHAFVCVFFFGFAGAEELFSPPLFRACEGDRGSKGQAHGELFLLMMILLLFLLLLAHDDIVACLPACLLC